MNLRISYLLKADCCQNCNCQTALCFTEDMKEAEEEPKEWVDDGSLPLDKDGQMMFYFLDAHEDAHLPHTVYLFGKVIFRISSAFNIQQA